MAFIFNVQNYEYLRHAYNQASLNMRTVEVPIVLDYISKGPRFGYVLEVGNVLSHYVPATWDIIDQYEEAAGVKNIDIMQVSGGRYELIVSISTVEHIGYDKRANTAKYTLIEIVTHIRSLLAPDGKLLITVPLGFRKDIDEAVSADQAAIGRYMYQSDAVSNSWEQCDLNKALSIKRGRWPLAVAFLEYGR